MTPRRTPSGTINAGSSGPGVVVSPAFVTAVLASIGIGLRVWQYLVNTSLWIDEAALARNIVDRPLAALVQPLDYAQVAPPAFLLVEKAFITLLGNSEWALRLFPLVCGLFAIGLFWRVASLTLTDWAVPYVVGLFAVAVPLVYFSSQVKQYSTDAAATALMLWVVLWWRQKQDSSRRMLAAASLGAAAVWFSHSAMFVLAGVGAALAIVQMREGRRDRLLSLLIVGGVWAISAGLAAALALRNVLPADRAYLDWYWSDGLMPVPPRGPDDALWLWRQLTRLFGTAATEFRRTNGALGYPWSPGFVVLSGVGIVGLWRRHRDTALILLSPVLATLVGAALHVYPFTGRALCFLLPVILLATAAGVDLVLTCWPQRLRFAVPALVALATLYPIYAMAAALPPERIQHLRPVIKAMASHRREGDATYVYYGAGQAYMYYAQRFGLAGHDVVIGRCSMTDLRVYLQDVDQFRGRPRVWVVATHARMRALELQTMTGYLDTIGRRLDSIEVPATSGFPSMAAHAYLYDLSDAGRLRTSSSDSHPVPTTPTSDLLARWGCYGTQSPLRRF